MYMYDKQQDYSLQNVYLYTKYADLPQLHAEGDQHIYYTHGSKIFHNFPSHIVREVCAVSFPYK